MTVNCLLARCVCPGLARKRVPYPQSGSSLILAILIVITFLASPAAGENKVSERRFPFAPGEKLIYRGRWGGIPAGEVALEVLPKTKMNGTEAYHFCMTTKTSMVVDLVYKVRERQDSFVDINMTHSLLYKKLTESKHARDVVVTFDWDKGQATRANFGIKEKPINIPAFCFDPLALFFVLRLQDMKENADLAIPVTDGSTNFATKARVAKGERIRIGDKFYDTFTVIPDMTRLEEAVKQAEEPDLKIWFTADDKKIPIKIQMRKGIVSFVFDLVSLPG